MRVPCAIIPSEFNLLLNPQHPDSDELERIGEELFVFDPRLRPAIR